MASNPVIPGPVQAPSAPEDLPPPYSAVVGNPQYGFVASSGEPGPYMPKAYTAPGVYPHPTITVTNAQPQPTSIPPPPPGVPVGIVLPPAVGNVPTTVSCFNCGKIVTTRVVYSTAWHTHLVAGSVCVVTMMCSLCCLGLIPYCFDLFKDAEHYCPNCNSFIGKGNMC